MREVAASLIVACIAIIAAFFVGKASVKCPQPPDPKIIIEEVEKIRYVDKPVYKTVEKTVEKIVEKPFYKEGLCLEEEALDAINGAIFGTSAGRALP